MREWQVLQVMLSPKSIWPFLCQVDRGADPLNLSGDWAGLGLGCHLLWFSLPLARTFSLNRASLGLWLKAWQASVTCHKHRRTFTSVLLSMVWVWLLSRLWIASLQSGKHLWGRRILWLNVLFSSVVFLFPDQAWPSPCSWSLHTSSGREMTGSPQFT